MQKRYKLGESIYTKFVQLLQQSMILNQDVTELLAGLECVEKDGVLQLVDEQVVSMQDFCDTLQKTLETQNVVEEEVKQ